jgi:Bacterial membrane protein YfhO
LIGRVGRALAASVLVLVLLLALSPLYRDFFADRRDRYRGTSIADFLGPMEYDRQLLHDFSWGAWFWNPDKAFGIPRVQDIGTRPMYPVHFALLAVMPAERAWHWSHVGHVLLKLVGLVLLGQALGWSLWIVVVAATGAMLAEGSLTHFADTTYLASAAWLPLQLWLTLKAARRPGFGWWDGAWVLAAALATLGSHPQYGTYYAILILIVTFLVERRDLRARLPVLGLRYVLYGLLIAPLFLPAVVHYAESGRRYIAAFDDWHIRRAYLWWKYSIGWRDIWTAVLTPPGAWAAIAVGLAIGRLRGTLLAPAFGAYCIFALFHAVPWLALPMWVTGWALLPFRIPVRAFEPLTWLGILLLAEQTGRETRPWRRHALAGLLVVASSFCAWQTQLDPATSYIAPPSTRELPQRLAAIVRSEPRAAVVFVTGPDKQSNDEAPLLNSNHNHLLRVPAAHFLGEVPNLYFTRATYRVPGLLFMQRMATPLTEWDDVVDVYAALGVGWVFWDGAGDPISPRLSFVGEEHGFRLYRVGAPQPKVYALDHVRRLASPRSPAEVAALVHSLPALGPFCYGCPARATASRVAEVTLKPSWRPGDITVDVDSPKGTLVVLGETRSRGWRATIDGRSTDILPVNEVFQGVAVPAGHHRIVWRFTSPGFFIGVGLAGVGLCALIGAPLASARLTGRAST